MLHQDVAYTKPEKCSYIRRQCCLHNLYQIMNLIIFRIIVEHVDVLDEMPENKMQFLQSAFKALSLQFAAEKHSDL